jgi:hypothetical protein
MNGLGPDANSVPLLESAERFVTAARKYLEELQSGGPASAQAAHNFGDFLRAEMLEFFRSPGAAGRDAAVWPPSSMDGAFALGPNREHQQRWQRTADTGRRVFDAQMKIHLMWSDALREAALAFAEKLTTLQRDATKSGSQDIESLRAVYDVWIECAEEAYARVAHSDSFSSALADFMNAGAALRTEARASGEVWAKALDLPTRSELNSVIRRVSSLEGELRRVSSLEGELRRVSSSEEELRRISSLEGELGRKGARRPSPAKGAKRRST